MKKEKKNFFGRVKNKKSIKKPNKKSSKNNKKDMNKENDEFDLDEIINKEYRKFKIKKILVSGCIIIIIIFLLVFGTYNTFLKPEKTSGQIATLVNKENVTTPFPTEGVIGYLELNINTLLQQNMNLLQGTSQFKVNTGNIYITYISKRSPYIANIYFSAIITTNTGAQTHNFMLSLKYDYNTGSYAPASNIQLSPSQLGNSTKLVNNEALSFTGMSEDTKVRSDSAKTFVNNFLVMVYNNKVSLSLYYSGGAQLGDPNVKFVSINDFKLYKTPNSNGYNASCTYQLTLSEGVSYNETTYFNVIQSGQSWIITAIL